MKTNIISILSITAMLVNCSSPDSENQETSQYESDQPGEIIDNKKLKASFTQSEYFSQWDSDGNSYVTPNEFEEGFFGLIDNNSDASISADEWAKGSAQFFGDVEMEKYQQETTWDTNSDGQIQPEEFQQGLEEIGYFSKWDNDGNDQLAEEEIAQGTFAMWDTDDNGVIEADEYKQSQTVEKN
ncbi:MAG: hypothetical protein RIG62_21435 [Cyclobacteriaceae bacterium]